MRYPAVNCCRPQAAAEEAGSSRYFTQWVQLLRELDKARDRIEAATKHNCSAALGFAFVEGALVRALVDGDWILLDEINLAPPEMLDCLSGLLGSNRGSLTLSERGYVLLLFILQIVMGL